MKSRKLLIAFSVAAILSVGFPTYALASCNPGRPNHSGMSFAGTFAKGVTGVRTIKANIEEYSPYIAGDDITAAWVMLNLGGSEWAQDGWAKEANGSRWTWAQWTLDSSPWVDDSFWPPSAIGSMPEYKTSFNPAVPGTPSEIVFHKNGSVLWRVRPAQFVPNTIQANGEIHNDMNQMPGGTNAPLWLDNVQYTVGGGWIDINTAGGATHTSWHGFQKVNGHFYKIWDKGCAT